jgi:hypothetical protein
MDRRRVSGPPCCVLLERRKGGDADDRDTHAPCPACASGSCVLHHLSQKAMTRPGCRP